MYIFWSILKVYVFLVYGLIVRFIDNNKYKQYLCPIIITVNGLVLGQIIKAFNQYVLLFPL